MPRQQAEMIPPVTQNPGPSPGDAAVRATAVPLWPARSKFARNGSIRWTSAVSVTRIPVQPLIAFPSGAMPEIRGVRNVVPHGLFRRADGRPIENSGVSGGKPLAGRTYPPVSILGFSCRLPAPRHQNCTAGPVVTLIVDSIA